MWNSTSIGKGKRPPSAAAWPRCRSTSRAPSFDRPREATAAMEMDAGLSKAWETWRRRRLFAVDNCRSRLVNRHDFSGIATLLMRYCHQAQTASEANRREETE